MRWRNGLESLPGTSKSHDRGEVARLLAEKPRVKLALGKDNGTASVGSDTISAIEGRPAAFHMQVFGTTSPRPSHFAIPDYSVFLTRKENSTRDP